MKILLYYPKTEKTEIIECEYVEVGVGGLFWHSRMSHGFIGHNSTDYKITIVSE